MLVVVFTLHSIVVGGGSFFGLQPLTQLKPNFKVGGLTEGRFLITTPSMCLQGITENNNKRVIPISTSLGAVDKTITTGK